MKKIKNLAIVFALIMAISALSGCGTNDNNADKGNNTNQTQTDKNSITNTASYTKGSIDGSTYLNEWADIKLVIPDGFHEVDRSTYSSLENSSNEFGLYIMADDATSLLYITFQKLPSYPIYDESDYLDSTMDTLSKRTDIEFNTSKSYTSATIGRHNYTKATFTYSNGYIDIIGNSYVRKINNYIVGISVEGASADSNDALVQKITSVD